MSDKETTPTEQQPEGTEERPPVPADQQPSPPSPWQKPYTPPGDQAPSPIPPGMYPPPAGPPDETFRLIKSARSFVLAASLMGPISLIIGGVPLSLAALICGILGFRKINTLSEPIDPRYQVAVRQMKRSSKISLIVCAVALALNLIYFIYVFPQALEAYQNGTYVDFLMGGNEGSGSGKSLWD